MREICAMSFCGRYLCQDFTRKRVCATGLCGSGNYVLLGFRRLTKISFGHFAVKAALARGKTKLLQPMEKVTFMVRDAIQGDVNGLVARFDGYITTSGPSNEWPGLTEIESILPSASIAGISEALRAMTSGEGRLTTEFSHYLPVSDHLLPEILGDKEAQDN